MAYDTTGGLGVRWMVGGGGGGDGETKCTRG